jgi:hypothetical protein
MRCDSFLTPQFLTRSEQRLAVPEHMPSTGLQATDHPKTVAVLVYGLLWLAEHI